MRTLQPGFGEHLDGEVTTVCHCWSVALADGTVAGFTDHDEALAFNGILFEPESGFQASEAETRLGLSTDGFDIAGVISSGRIEETDLAGGRYLDALVSIYLVNWSDTVERALLRTARIASVTRDGGVFAAELVSATADFTALRGRVFSKRCDALLGDHRCGVDIDNGGFRVQATVVSVDSFAAEVSGIASYAGGWFQDGILDPGNAETVRIVAHLKSGAGVRLRFSKDVSGILAAGQAVSLTAGCDKRFATCRAKFLNHLNFRGFPHLPGNDAAYAYASSDAKLDGGVLVR